MKRVPRLLVAALPEAGGPVELDAEGAHHALHVLRLEPGQTLEALDGRGARAEATLVVAGRRASLDCGPCRREIQTLPRLEAWLPLVRPERQEWAVEKLTELGVAVIILYHSDRTGNQRRPPALERLGRVAEAALRQSGNPWRPELRGPLDLAELLARPDPPLALADRAGPAQGLSLLAGTADMAGPPASLALLAGPEGGFSPEEMQVLGKRCRSRIGLGPHVLRAESALVILAGLAQALAHRP